MVNKGKILVVDDNPGIRAALKILLPKYFAAVELLASPKEIHASLREFAPDVILLDMNFEADTNTGNEGLFWLSEIKQRRPQTEVVLFTAYATLLWRWKDETWGIRLHCEALGERETHRYLAGCH